MSLTRTKENQVLLPDHEIRAAIEAGHVGVDPYDPSLVQPASIDVRLGESLLLFRKGPGETDKIVIPPDDGFILKPGGFVLACTLEAFTLPPDIAGRIEGKSSVGRLGLLVHSTAGWIDPGFTGQVTLELSNVAPSPVRLWPGMRIGQLCLFRMSSAAERPYGSPGLGSRYQGQRGPTPARVSDAR